MKKINLFFLSAIMLLSIAPVSANAQSVDGVSLPSDWTATKSGNIVSLAYSGNNIVKSVKVKYTNICFSVSEDSKVIFSHGNLQYHPKNKKWRFAEHQYDYLDREYNNNPSINTNWWIDLFGWGTAEAPTKSIAVDSEYASFKDWGTKVSDSQNKWRTMKGREWWYLMTQRPNASKLYGVGEVNGTNGIIILPDNWELPAGLTFTYGHNQYGNTTYEYYEKVNQYTAEQWEVMEAAGALFLPAGGRRDGNESTLMNVKESNQAGYYWACDYDINSGSRENKAYGFHFSWKTLSPSFQQYRHYGSSVRLVKDASNIDTEMSAEQDASGVWKFTYQPNLKMQVIVEYVNTVTAQFTGSYTYNATQQKPSPKVRCGNLEIIDTQYSVNYPTDVTNAGTKACTIVVKNNAGGTFTINASYTIAKKALTLLWSNTSFVYDGSKHAPTASVSGAIGNDNPTITVSGEQTNKGTYTATATLSNNPNSNYTLSSNTQSFTIAQKELTLSWSNTSFVYDGEVHAPTATISGAVGNDKPTVTVSGGKTYKGTYTATASLSSNPNSNYKLPNTKTQSFTINPKEVALEWSETTLTYNGSAQNPTATAIGLVGNDVCNITVSGAQTNAGTYTATASTLSNSNYKLPEAKTIGFTIAPKVVENPAIELSATSFTYNGVAQTPTVTVKDGETTIKPSEYTMTMSADVTNAGIKNVTITDNADGNYTVNGSTTFNIAPNTSVVVTITENSSEVTYNTEEQTVNGYTFGINDILGIYSEDDFNFTGSAVASGTTVGTYPMQLSASDFSNLNHNFANVQFVIEDGALTINKAPEAPNKPGTTIETRFINTELLALPENWQWTENKVLELGSNTVTAEYMGTDTGNYVLERVDIAITCLECPHNEGNDILYAVAPTCTEAGYSGNLSCKLCGMVYQHGDSLQATGHKADSLLFKKIVSATCTEAGSYDSVVYCSVCHVVVSNTHITTTANGHTVVVDEAVAATATTDGLTEGSHCSVCHETLVAQEIIPATGEQGGEGDQGETGNEQGGEQGNGNENQGGNEQGGNNQENGNENQHGGENIEPATAISESAAQLVNIYAHHNIIVVENADAEICVYNIMGGLVAKANDTNAEIIIDTTGVYVVKVGNTAKRVMINN